MGDRVIACIAAGGQFVHLHVSGDICISVNPSPVGGVQCSGSAVSDADELATALQAVVYLRDLQEIRARRSVRPVCGRIDRGGSQPFIALG